MAAYKVTFKPAVEKDLASLSKGFLARVLKRTEMLGEHTFPRGVLKLEGSEGLYRLRVGDYRIVYGVDSPRKQVVIHYVRHRREVYRRLS